MKCGHCGYRGQGGTPEARWDDLTAHLKTHPPRVITDLREIFPADAFGDDGEKTATS